MTSLQKTILKFFAGFLVIGLFVLIVIQLWAKSAISEFLDSKIPSNVKLAYQDIDINILKGSVEFQRVSATFMVRDTLLKHAEIKMDALKLDNLSYWDYLIHTSIKFKNVLFVNPDILTYSRKALPKKDSLSSNLVDLQKSISVDMLSVKNANFTVKDDNDSVLVKVAAFNFKLYGIATDSLRITNKLPITFDGYSLSTSKIFVDLGPYEAIHIDSLHVEDGELRINTLKLASKYNKRELSRILTREHDHIGLTIPIVSLQQLKFGFHDQEFFISAAEAHLDQPNVEIYRDKLIDDDLETKRLYSRMLRELPIELSIEVLKIDKGHIGYEELVNVGSKAGRIYFEAVDATLSNVSNTYSAENKTSIEAKAHFMGQAPVTLDWNFDMNNTNDFFTASGSFSNFEAKSINQFLEPNMGVRTKGSVDALYFTISGNAIQSSGEMKMKYDDFEFIILKKDRLAVNKVLTAIGKMFMASNSNSEEKAYRFGTIDVERDPTKSFFNYLWLNVRDGVVSTLTGNGKK